MQRPATSWFLSVAASGVLLAACADEQNSPLTPTLTSLPTPQEVGGWIVESVEPFGTNRVNTVFGDGCPIESPDGRSLFIASNRGNGEGGIDIWAARRSGMHGPWGEPENVCATVNSAFDDFCPTPLVGGDLLFVSRRANEGVCGRTASSSDTDIYLARWHPVRGWLEPENVSCAVNSTGDEFSPSYVPAGGGQLFFSSDRGTPGQHRIYVSRALSGGDWAPPEAVQELNNGGNAFRPM